MPFNESGCLLVLAENWGQPANLGSQGSTNVLRLVGNELLDAWHHFLEESLAFEERAETRNLPGDGAPYFGLGVF